MSFADARPFPHLVIDNYLPDAEADAVAYELEHVDLSPWHRSDHASQVNKYWMPNPFGLPPMTAGVVVDLDHPTHCADLSDVVGIPELQPDPTHEGGGVHVHTTGGSLGVHADFNQHPTTGLHRRLNLLLYLNRDWDPSWGGQLELWSAKRCEACELARTAEPPPGVVYFIKPGTVHTHCTKCGNLGWVPKECVQRIEPVFNRAVILATTDYGFHGVTPVTCPPDRRRISIAAYYYTATRPAGEASDTFHWSVWPEKPRG